MRTHVFHTFTLVHLFRRIRLYRLSYAHYRLWIKISAVVGTSPNQGGSPASRSTGCNDQKLSKILLASEVSV